MLEDKIVSRHGSGVRHTRTCPHIRLVNLALAEAISRKFSRPGHGEVITVLEDNGLVRLHGWWYKRRINMSFYTNTVGLCDNSGSPCQEIITWAEKVIRTLFEDELVFSRYVAVPVSFGRGEMMKLQAEDEGRAIALVYAAILKLSQRPVANRMARRISSSFPLAERLPGIYLGDLRARAGLNGQHPIRE